MASPDQAIYRFGPYHLDSGQGCVKRDGELIRLTPKAFATLRALVEQSGDVLSKELLLQQVWADSFVEEGVLAQNVATLRKVLGTTPDGIPYIETIPKRGYRFCAPVEIQNRLRSLPETASLPALPVENRNGTAGPTAETKATLAAPRFPRSIVWIGTLAVVALLGESAYFSGRHLAASPFASQKEVLVVVMPAGNYTPDPSDDYLSEGFTEQMIRGLGGILPSHLKVVPFPIALSLKGDASSREAIRDRLGANYLLYSDLLLLDDQTRVRSRLVRASDGRAVWVGVYPPDTQDVRKMSRDIALNLAKDAGIDSKNLPEPKIAGQIENEKAFREYLQGRYFLNLRSREGLDQAIQHFKSGIELEPKYAEAYAGLAESYNLQVFYGWTASREGIAQAMAASQKAIELDDESAEAHAALAYAKFFWKHDWDGAERHFQRALQLDPDLASAHHWYALSLIARGRNQEAVEQIRIAQRLNPLSRGVLSGAAYVYYLSHDYGKAVEQCNKALALYGDLMSAFAVRGLALEQQGRPKEAVTDFEKALSIQGGTSTTYLGYLAHAEATLGRRHESEQILERLWQTDKHGYGSPISAAAVYTAMGKQPEAVRWVSVAIDENDVDVVWLRADPRFTILHENPTFRKLTDSVFLAPIQTARETAKDSGTPIAQ